MPAIFQGSIGVSWLHWFPSHPLVQAVSKLCASGMFHAPVFEIGIDWHQKYGPSLTLWHCKAHTCLLNLHQIFAGTWQLSRSYSAVIIPLSYHIESTRCFKFGGWLAVSAPGIHCCTDGERHSCCQLRELLWHKENLQVGRVITAHCV